jgi:hypothetical protein
MVCSGFGFELRSSGIGYLPLPSRGPRGPSGLPIGAAGACHALARARQCAGRIARSIPCSGCGSIPAWWAARSGAVGGFASQTWPQGWPAPCGRRPAPPRNRPCPPCPLAEVAPIRDSGSGGYSRLSAAPTRSRRSSRPTPVPGHCDPKLTARIKTAT